MELNEFIQQINEAIPEDLRHEIQLRDSLTASETAQIVSLYCPELYKYLGQKLPTMLVNTFQLGQLNGNHIYINATRIGGDFPKFEQHHFLYVSPTHTLIDQDIYFNQYGNADVQITNGRGCIFNNQLHADIQDIQAVSLFGNTQATVSGKTRVDANDNTRVVVKDNVYAIGNDSSYLIADGDVTIRATNYANIEVIGGSPIIQAQDSVRIANCLKPGSDQKVRLDIAESVIVANYTGNSPITTDPNTADFVNIIYLHATDPAMKRFIDQMKARSAVMDQHLIEREPSNGFTTLPEVKRYILRLIHNESSTDAINALRSSIEQAKARTTILNAIVANMPLFVANGLNKQILDEHFRRSHLTQKGIFTKPSQLTKSSQKQIYLFGYGNYAIPNSPCKVQAFEHTAILGEQLSVVMHDHSLCLSNSYKTVELYDQTFAGGILADKLTQQQQSIANLGSIEKAELHDQSELVNYIKVQQLNLAGEAKAYCYNPPIKMIKQSSESKLHYVPSIYQTKIEGHKEGITIYQKDNELTAVLTQNSASRSLPKEKNQRIR